MFGSKLNRSNQREGDGEGTSLGRESGGGGQGPFRLSGAPDNQNGPYPQTPGDYPKGHNTAFIPRRKFEIKIKILLLSKLTSPILNPNNISMQWEIKLLPLRKRGCNVKWTINL